MSTVEVGDYEYPPVGDRARAEALPHGTPGLRPEESSLPYRFDPIDASPAFSPVGGPHITRFTGSSHDEHGMLTKDPAKVGRLNEHLRRKIEDHADEIVMVDADLQEDARTLLISYGITARAMSEAANTARDARTGRLDPHHPEPVARAGGCASPAPSAGQAARARSSASLSPS